MARERQLSNIDKTLIKEMASRFDFEPDAFTNEVEKLQIEILIGDAIEGNIPTAKERKSDLESLLDDILGILFVFTAVPLTEIEKA